MPAFLALYVSSGSGLIVLQKSEVLSKQIVCHVGNLRNAQYGKCYSFREGNLGWLSLTPSGVGLLILSSIWKQLLKSVLWTIKEAVILRFLWWFSVWFSLPRRQIFLVLSSCGVSQSRALLPSLCHLALLSWFFMSHFL